MYLCYDAAVQSGLNTYRRLEYADSCRSAFRVTSNEFKKYMEYIGLPYSNELAQQWINDRKEHWHLPKSECNKFLRFFNTIEKDISRSKAEYAAAAKQLADIHKIRKYSPSIRKLASQTIRDFRIFMDANLFAYSNDLALKWLEFQREKWSRAKYLSFRRVLLSINEILNTATLSTSRFSTHEPKYLLPEWGDDLLSQYLRERECKGCASSTLDMIRCLQKWPPTLLS